MPATDIGVWDAVAPWLLTDINASPLIPLNAHNGLSGVGTLLPRIHRRRAPQSGPRPYAIVTGPVGFSDGTHSTGVLPLKVCRFNVIVVAESSVSEIGVAVNRIRSVMNSVRGRQVGDWWVNSFQLQDLDEDEAENPKANELAFPAIVMQWLAGASYRPA